MKILAYLFFFALTLFLSKSQTFPKPADLENIFKNFGKNHDSTLNSLTSSIQQKILHELLKFSLNDILNSSLTTTPINITHVNFQNIMPFMNFLKKLNLTNHSIEELEKIIWEILPSDFNTTTLEKLKADKPNWEVFLEDFITKSLNKFSTNNTNFLEHITEKLKQFYKKETNSSYYDIDQKFNIIANQSNDSIINKDEITNLAKNLHKQIKGEQTDELKDSNAYIGLTISLIVLFVLVIVVVGFFIRRRYMKRQSENYNQMESTQLNT